MSLGKQEKGDGKEVEDDLAQASSYMNKMKERMKEIDSQITTVVTIPQYSKHLRTQLAKLPREYYRETKDHYMSLYEHLTKLYDIDPYVYRQREEGYSPNTNHVFPYSQNCAQCNHKCSVKVDPYDPYHVNPMVLSDKCNRNHLHRWVEFVDLNPFYLLRKDIHEVWSVNRHCYVPQVKREVVMPREDAYRLMFLLQQEDFDFELFLIESQRRFEENELNQKKAAIAQANLLRGNQPNSYSVRLSQSMNEQQQQHMHTQQSDRLSQQGNLTDRSNEKPEDLNARLLAQEEENRQLREQVRALQLQQSQGGLSRKKVQINEKSSELLPIRNHNEVLMPPSELEIIKKYNDQYKVKPSQRDIKLLTVQPKDPEYHAKIEQTKALAVAERQQQQQQQMSQSQIPQQYPSLSQKSISNFSNQGANNNNNNPRAQNIKEAQVYGVNSMSQFDEHDSLSQTSAHRPKELDQEYYSINPETINRSQYSMKM